ncbi:acyltransferase family protein [Agrobacterium tumefaciens]|uniref:acyltransferase family protein n=1 Tax=Agrobacterium tumefaciens TaxID=358 RepID=UPI0015738C8F
MLTATKGYLSGWDYVRPIVAAGVIVVHSLPLNHGIAARWAIPTPLMALAQVLLPMFFALSGFLVAASLLRVPIPNFIGLRVLRIFPDLADLRPNLPPVFGRVLGFQSGLMRPIFP